jgi:hypothetical protein
MCSRRLFAATLMLGAALTAAPAALAASPSSSGSQAPSVTTRALDQAWDRLLGWVGAVLPNGQRLGAPAMTRPAAERRPAVRPGEGCGPDPNGGHCGATPLISGGR